MNFLLLLIAVVFFILYACGVERVAFIRTLGAGATFAVLPALIAAYPG